MRTNTRFPQHNHLIKRKYYTNKFKGYYSKCICSAQSENLDNSGIVPREVRIPTLADRVRILTLHGSIPELSVRKVGIGTK